MKSFNASILDTKLTREIRENAVVERLSRSIIRGDLDSTKHYYEKLQRLVADKHCLHQSRPKFLLPQFIEDAIVNQHAAIVEYFIQDPLNSGFALFSTNSEGKLPIQLAQEKGFHEIENLLQEYTDKNIPNASSYLETYIKDGSFESFQYLIKQGVEISAETVKYVLLYDELEMAQFLFDIGKLSQQLLNDTLASFSQVDITDQSKLKKCFNILIDYGADVNTRTEDNNSYILHKVVAKGWKEIAQLLFENGADPQLKTYEGLTALDIAKHYRDPYGYGNGHHTFNFLNKPNPNVISKKPKTISTIIQSGDLQSLKSLIQENADHINAPLNRNGDTPLIIAVEYEQMKIVKYLTDSGANVCKDNNAGETPLMKSAANGNVDICKYLLKEGAILTMITALPVAIKNKHLQIVQIFIDNGVIVDNIVGKEGNTPLIESILAKNIDILKLLVDNGADLTASNKKGEKPLEIATRINFHKGIQFLLEKGCDPNFVLTNGTSLLNNAIQSKKFDLVKTMIEKGADINKCDWNDQYPVNVALNVANPEIVQLLLDYNVDLGKTRAENFANYIKNDHFDTIKELIKSGVDAKIKINGETLLHIYIKTNNVDMVKFLVRNGADVNQPNKNHKTPLVQALELDNFKLFKILANNKTAELNKKDLQGMNLLSLAAQKRNLAIVDYLIGSGVDVEDSVRDLMKFAEVEENFKIYMENLKRASRKRRVSESGHEEAQV